MYIYIYTHTTTHTHIGAICWLEKGGKIKDPTTRHPNDLFVCQHPPHKRRHEARFCVPVTELPIATHTPDSTRIQSTQ